MKKQSIVFGIPGGWYGNDPGFLDHDPKMGNVAVAPDRIADAVTWLRKRARIVSTCISRDINPGISITYELR